MIKAIDELAKIHNELLKYAVNACDGDVKEAEEQLQDFYIGLGDKEYISETYTPNYIYISIRNNYRRKLKQKNKYFCGIEREDDEYDVAYVEYDIVEDNDFELRFKIIEEVLVELKNEKTKKSQFDYLIFKQYLKTKNMKKIAQQVKVSFGKVQGSISTTKKKIQEKYNNDKIVNNK